MGLDIDRLFDGLSDEDKSDSEEESDSLKQNVNPWDDAFCPECKKLILPASATKLWEKQFLAEPNNDKLKVQTFYCSMCDKLIEIQLTFVNEN